MAYEAATADLEDVNMIDTFHLAKYGETTVNYNRDIEAFPLLRRYFDEDLRRRSHPLQLSYRYGRKPCRICYH